MNTATSPTTKEFTTGSDTAQFRTNAYPRLRRFLFGLIILFFVVVILFLIYQNGKSIYDNGI